MSKVKDLERSIEVIGGQLAAVQMLIDAMIVEGIRTKNIDEKEFMILLEQGMGAFQNNKNMSSQETFGAIASHQRKPLRLMKIIPLNTRLSSTRGLPRLFGKNGRSRII